MRKTIVISWLVILSILIGYVFWHNEFKYKLPTPVPPNYTPVAQGTTMAVPVTFENSQPIFIHFFNPDCPCSRFNIAHFKSLVKDYGNDVNFMIVPMSSKDISAKEIEVKFGLSIPVIKDTSLARKCGVYATPQAVIINKGQLFYRGNYNRARYCTDKKTAYARLALESLLSSQKILFDQHALTAYGCQLPNCTK